MSPMRPDLVACWLFRVGTAGGLEILLIRRGPGTYAGLWQCVTGRLEPNETIVAGALREVAEETGLGEAEIEAVFETDIVNWFHEASVDGLLSEAVFAARVRADVEITLSDEHDALRWVTPAEAREIVVWPAYRVAITQIEWLHSHPELARWLRVGLWAVEGPSPPDSR